MSLHPPHPCSAVVLFCRRCLVPPWVNMVRIWVNRVVLMVCRWADILPRIADPSYLNVWVVVCIAVSRLVTHLFSSVVCRLGLMPTWLCSFRPWLFQKTRVSGC